MAHIHFTKTKDIPKSLGRAGVIETKNGVIETPAFVVVGTKATVKGVSPEQLKDLGTQVVLANTYHLYLEPGEKSIHEQGSLGKYMRWSGPTMTDSGGFQAFSLGAAFGSGVSKIASGDEQAQVDVEKSAHEAAAKITEDGVEFKSIIDGSTHFFTPEKSMEIQHGIGADIMFAFDECTSPLAPKEYQKEAMERTHRWAERSLAYHKANNTKDQALLGIVQGGRFEDLRKESAEIIGAMDFDGYAIGGSFNKEDMDTALGWVNERLPEDKMRHLLGIGEPRDLFGAVENGADTFDCVAATRIGRNGTIYTQDGQINIFNAKFRDDNSLLDPETASYASQYSLSYIAHLFRSKEIFGATLASIHNLHFIVNLVKKMRQSILDENFFEFKEEFMKRYYGE
jgi:queuine tRNA-ribosyltransferase